MNYFGTDGIRGRAGKELTGFLTAKLAQALGEYLLNEQEKPRVVIGRDTRPSGAGYEEIISLALADMGIDVIALGVLPTPAIAFYIKYYNAGAGVVISASHNPPEYNGIKVFDARGYKFTEIEEAKLEELMDMTLIARPRERGSIEHPADGTDYIDYIIRETRPDLRGLRVCLDCAEGAGYKIAPAVFKRLTPALKVMAANGKGEKINVGCGATHPEALARFVVDEGYDIGFCFDGDADRLIAIDGDGTVIDGDGLLYMHAVDMLERQRLKDGVIVGTVMSNLGFERALKQKGIRLVREPVGDKYVFNRMITRGYNLGGEQSGHIIFTDYQTTGDGILSAVLTASLAARKGKSLRELVRDIKPCPQILTFIEADTEAKRRFEGDQALRERIQDIHDQLEDRGRVVVRPSGTENKIRIMVEAETLELANQTESAINRLICAAIGK